MILLNRYDFVFGLKTFGIYVIFLVIEFFLAIENLFVAKQDLAECVFWNLFSNFCTFHNVFFCLASNKFRHTAPVHTKMYIFMQFWRMLGNVNFNNETFSTCTGFCLIPRKIWMVCRMCTDPGCQHYKFFPRSTEFRKWSVFLQIFIRSLAFSNFLQILQFFDFFQHFFFEYKYIWRDRNTSFSKMRSRYDKAHCSDNFNHKKVILHRYRWAPVSDCRFAFAYCCLWLQTW